MDSAILINLSQIIILSLTIVVVMLCTAFRRDHGLVNALTIGGLGAALVVFLLIEPELPLAMTEILVLDHFSLLFSCLVIAGAMAVAIMSYSYFSPIRDRVEEFYILLLLATLGAVILICSTHFVAFIIGMETLGISLYAMIAYPVHEARSSKCPIEASVKYLVMSGLTTAVSLFGIALIYAETGTLAFAEIAAASSERSELLTLVGLMMLFVGIAFKLSLVPFHMWTPDVYEGAPTPVTTYLATVGKASMVAVTLRFVIASNSYEFIEFIIVMSVLAAASMIMGNLLALLQENIKRLLAYSSIAHLGYLLVAVIATTQIDTEFSVEAVSFYTLGYFIMTTSAFAVVNSFSNSETEMDQLADYQGLAWRSPWRAIVLITALISLAGIPLSAGFIGKFYLFSTGVESELWLLMACLVIGSAIGLYYYLRLIYVMLKAPARAANEIDPAVGPLSFGNHAVLAASTALILLLGVYPEPFIRHLMMVAGTF